METLDGRVRNVYMASGITVPFEKYFASYKIRELSQTIIRKKKTARIFRVAAKSVLAMRCISFVRRNKNHKKLSISFTRDSDRLLKHVHFMMSILSHQTTDHHSGKIVTHSQTCIERSYLWFKVYTFGRASSGTKWVSSPWNRVERTEYRWPSQNSPKTKAYSNVSKLWRKGKLCRKCGKCNHFGKVCRGQSKFKQNDTKSGGKHPKKPIYPIDRAGNDTDHSDENYLCDKRSENPENHCQSLSH